MPPFVEVAADSVEFYGTVVGSSAEGPMLMLVFGDDLETGEVLALTMVDAIRLAVGVKQVLVDHALASAR